MASVEIARLAREDLAGLIATRSLPADTEERIWRSLLTLEQFPRSGRPLAGIWSDYRALVGPWDWVIAVYTYVERDDRVVVVAFQDARSGGSAMSAGDA
jgi:plasmid stabilization system protein ParE